MNDGSAPCDKSSGRGRFGSSFGTQRPKSPNKFPGRCRPESGLTQQTIDASERFTLRNIAEGTYDLKLADEDGTECVVEDADFDQSKVWTVTK